MVERTLIVGVQRPHNSLDSKLYHALELRLIHPWRYCNEATYKHNTPVRISVCRMKEESTNKVGNPPKNVIKLFIVSYNVHHFDCSWNLSFSSYKLSWYFIVVLDDNWLMTSYCTNSHNILLWCWMITGWWHHIVQYLTQSFTDVNGNLQLKLRTCLLSTGEFVWKKYYWQRIFWEGSIFLLLEKNLPRILFILILKRFASLFEFRMSNINGKRRNITKIRIKSFHLFIPLSFYVCSL